MNKRILSYLMMALMMTGVGHAKVLEISLSSLEDTEIARVRCDNEKDEKDLVSILSIVEQALTENDQTYHIILPMVNQTNTDSFCYALFEALSEMGFYQTLEPDTVLADFVQANKDNPDAGLCIPLEIGLSDEQRAQHEAGTLPPEELLNCMGPIMTAMEDGDYGHLIENGSIKVQVTYQIDPYTFVTKNNVSISFGRFLDREAFLANLTVPVQEETELVNIFAQIHHAEAIEYQKHILAKINNGSSIVRKIIFTFNEFTPELNSAKSTHEMPENFAILFQSFNNLINTHDDEPTATAS